VLDSGFTFENIEKRFAQDTLRLDTGGFFSKHEPMFRSGQSLPAWMAGEWDVVNCTVDKVTQTAGEKFAARSTEGVRSTVQSMPWSPVGPHFEAPNGTIAAGRQLKPFRLRWSADGVRAAPDVAYNYAALAEAFNGGLPAAGLGRRSRILRMCVAMQAV
jgi:hypothetical protein